MNYCSLLWQLWILTLQNSNSYQSIVRQSILLWQGKTTQNNDIEVYTVGVGAGVNEQELKGTASTPSNRYYYHADTFDAVNDLSKIIGPKICNGGLCFDQF